MAPDAAPPSHAKRAPEPGRPFAVVLTTINVPQIVARYCRDFAEHGRNARVFVVGDVNTPREAAEEIARLRATGAPVEYLDLDAQAALLAPLPALAALLPLRSIQRRNVGTLAAYAWGAEVIVSIDDDNHVESPDFLGGHALVGGRHNLPAVSTRSGWWNPCALCEAVPPRRFYHRGFPLSRRWHEGEPAWAEREGRVAVNAGLWLGDPDVDTLTRLEEPFEVARLALPAPHVALGPGMRAPWNSQNTAAVRDLLPFLYLVVAGPSLRGFRTDFRNFRYDDIWMSYLGAPAIERMGDLVSYGQPIVRQRRNPHDLLVDLDREHVPLLLTETLVAMLERITLTGRDYPSLHGELVEALATEATRTGSHALPEAERTFFGEVVAGLRVWGEACARVMRGAISSAVVD